jgi:hypothetical protein
MTQQQSNLPTAAEITPFGNGPSSYQEPEYAEVDTPISPQLKQDLADQVAQQVAAENAAAQDPAKAANATGLPSALQPGHLFVADRPLSVIGDDGRSCSLTAGDVLQLSDVPALDATAGQLTVTASRKGDCPAYETVSVALTDLQDMHNAFRTQLDASLQTLRNQQGQSGLPPAPPSAIAPPPRPAEDMPPPAADAPSLVNGAQQQADRTEAQLSQSAFSN